MPRDKRKNIGQGAASFLPPEPQEQHNNTPAQQDTSIPVDEQSQESEKADFKVTYYITEALDLKLEQIRLARRKRGIKVDKSALVREAIRLLQE